MASSSSRRGKGRDVVIFDGEEEWDQRDGAVYTENRGNVARQALASVGLVADGLTAIAMQFVPETTSYNVVKGAVVGGIVLVVLSFVKGLLSLILTVGTMVLGAYVWVKLFGMEPPEYNSTLSNVRRGKKNRKARRSSKDSNVTAEALLGQGQQLLSSLVSSRDDDDDDGLLDVKFVQKKRK
ncbi:hypothetical protein M9434_002416 [Picochlorum sp. BPE23]|nr:hypothetical protein M9434_002416 [Picochlorum sp. BPE23]